RHHVGLGVEQASYGVVEHVGQQHLDRHSPLRAELAVQEHVGEAAGAQQLLVLVAGQPGRPGGRSRAHALSPNVRCTSSPRSRRSPSWRTTPSRGRSRTGSKPSRCSVVPLVVPRSIATTCHPSSRSSRCEREMSCCGLGTVISCGTSFPLTREARGRRPMIAVRSSTKGSPPETCTTPSGGRVTVRGGPCSGAPQERQAGRSGEFA